MPIKLRLLISPLAVLVAVAGALVHTGAAHASTNQVALFEADNELLNSPGPALSELRSLGVGEVRLSVRWDKVYVGAETAARRPSGLIGADPRAPQYDWSAIDRVVAQAPAYGIVVDLSLTGGAPMWATGGGKVTGASTAWNPSASAYGDFVRAAATRYSGNFSPGAGAPALPRVRVWELWNEPNFGPDLDPQTTNHGSVPNSPKLYRALLDAGWTALSRAGHGHDTVIIGNLDARGNRTAGVFGATKPVLFIRDLYCLDGRLRPLSGRAAKAQNCPTTKAGSRAFRRQHPGLFAATGFADHPYPFASKPNGLDTRSPDDAQLAQVPHMTRVLDQIQRRYGSRHRFAIYDNEYGYITNPPNRSQHFPSPAVAAGYLNWAEYIHYTNPRMASFMQFLLADPNPRQAPEYGGFASGLKFFGGAAKPSYDAYRLPVYVPATTVRRGGSLLVWGCARPAHAYHQPRVQVQLRSGTHGAFVTVATLRVRNVRGYFETHVKIRHSGALRLSWSYPHGRTVTSRVVTVTAR